MRRQRIHIHTRRFRCIAESFILCFSIHLKTLESRAETMKRTAGQLHDPWELQTQAPGPGWLSNRAFRCCGSHDGRLFSQVFNDTQSFFWFANKSPQPCLSSVAKSFKSSDNR